MINLTENEVIKSMLISKEAIKSEDSSLRVENTAEGLKASISCIESNKMEQETSTKGKNIIPTTKEFWESGHYDTAGKKANFSTRIRLLDLEKCEANTEYFVSKSVYILRGYNSNKEMIQNIGVINGINNQTFTTDENVVFLGVAVDKTYDEYDEETDQFMICKNSEADKTWEKGYVDMPSLQYKSEVVGVTGDVNLKVQTKNYYDASINEQTLNNITYSADKKVLKLNGNLNKESKIIFAPQNLKKGKYVLHLKLKNGVISSELKDSILFYIYKENTWTRVTSTGITLNNSKPAGKIVFDFNEDYKIQLGTFIRTQDVLKDVKIEYEIVRVEDDSEKFNFIEHEEQNFKVSLGDKILYKGDKIIRQNGKWYFSLKWKTVDDFSNLVKESTSAGMKRARLALSDNVVNVSHIFSNKSFSNILNCIGDGATYNNIEGFTVSLPGNYPVPQMFVYIKEFEDYSKEEYQQGLNELRAYFVLPLKNEELELIEDENLISQLDAILMYLTEYNDITNFDFDKDVIFEIEVEKDNLRIMNSRLNKADENTTNATMAALESEDLI